MTSLQPVPETPAERLARVRAAAQETPEQRLARVRAGVQGVAVERGTPLSPSAPTPTPGQSAVARAVFEPLQIAIPNPELEPGKNTDAITRRLSGNLRPSERRAEQERAAVARGEVSSDRAALTATAADWGENILRAIPGGAASLVTGAARGPETVGTILGAVNPFTSAENRQEMARRLFPQTAEKMGTPPEHRIGQGYGPEAVDQAIQNALKPEGPGATIGQQIGMLGTAHLLGMALREPRTAPIPREGAPVVVPDGEIALPGAVETPPARFRNTDRIPEVQRLADQNRAARVAELQRIDAERGLVPRSEPTVAPESAAPAPETATPPVGMPERYPGSDLRPSDIEGLNKRMADRRAGIAPEAVDEGLSPLRRRAGEVPGEQVVMGSAPLSPEAAPAPVGEPPVAPAVPETPEVGTVPPNDYGVNRPMRVVRLDLPEGPARKVAAYVRQAESGQRPVTWDEVRAEAATNLNNPELLKHVDPTRATGAEILAISKVVRENQLRMDELGKGLVESKSSDPGGVKSPDAQLAHMKELMDLNAEQELLVSKIVAGGTQMGRDLNTLKILANLSNDPVHWTVRAQRLAERPLTGLERDTIFRLAERTQTVTLEDAKAFLRQRFRAKVQGELGAVGDINAILRKFEKNRKQVDLFETTAGGEAATEAAKAMQERGLVPKTITLAEQKTLIDFITAQRRAELLRYVGTLRKATLGSKPLTAWKAGLLTNPVTHQVNIVANTTFAAMEDIAQSPAAFGDWAMSLASGQRTKTHYSLRQLQAELQGGLKGIKEIPDVLRGLPVGSQVTVGQVPWETHFKNPILNGLVNGPFRLLNAEDRVATGAAYMRSLAEQAELRATERGIPKAGQAAFIEDAIMNPTDDMIWRAGEDALVRTFRDETMLGNVLSGLQRNAGTVGQVVVPFTKTPGAVATHLAETSPYGIVKGVYTGQRAVRAIRAAIKAGKPVTREMLRAQQLAAETFGRGTVGSLDMLAGYVLYKIGAMNSALPPDDRTGRETAYLTGEVPGAIKVGDTRIDVVRSGIPAMAMVVGATIAAMTERSSGSKLDVAASAVGAGATLITDQPFLQGVERMLDVLRDPTHLGQGLSRQAGSIVPAGLAALARSIDPVVRVKGGPLDEVQGRLPFASQGLPAKAGPLGGESRIAAQGPQNLLSPVKVSTVPHDAAVDAIRESGARVSGRAREKRQTIKLSATQSVTIPAETAALYAERLRAEGPIVRQRVLRLVRAPYFKNMDSAAQADAIEKEVRDARSELSRRNRQRALYPGKP